MYRYGMSNVFEKLFPQDRHDGGRVCALCHAKVLAAHLCATAVVLLRCPRLVCVGHSDVRLIYSSTLTLTAEP